MPILTIDLPEHLDLKSRAATAGSDSVEAYVRNLIIRHADGGAKPDIIDKPQRLLPREEWLREFQQLLDSCKSTNPKFDDSRESIYPVRL